MIRIVNAIVILSSLTIRASNTATAFAGISYLPRIPPHTPLSASSSPSDDSTILASLQKRQSEIQSQSHLLLQKWLDADFETTVGLTLDDWIRRIHFSKWPLAVVGSARGGVEIVDLSRGEVVASPSEDAAIHAAIGGDVKAMELLFGDFEGSGTLGVFIKGDFVVSCGREGGVKLWKVDLSNQDLISLGTISSLEGTLVTSLVLDDEQRIWAGCFDGTLHCFNYDLSSDSFAMCDHFTKLVDSPLLSVAVDEDIGLVVCATQKGTMELFSIEDGSFLSSCDTFHNTHARSVAILETTRDSSDPSKNTHWSLVCGGGDGTMRMKKLNIDKSTGWIHSTKPFLEREQIVEMLPKHNGQVVSLASTPKGNFVISGAHDGSLRVWDCSNIMLDKPELDNDCEDNDTQENNAIHDGKPICIYHLMGYKVWLGSVCTDGIRLLSDGSDNTILVHDFSVTD